MVPVVYVLALAGLLASYFVNEEKRREALTGVAFVLVGAAVYGLFLRGRTSPARSASEGV